MLNISTLTPDLRLKYHGTTFKGSLADFLHSKNEKEELERLFPGYNPQAAAEAKLRLLIADFGWEQDLKDLFVREALKQQATSHIKRTRLEAMDIDTSKYHVVDRLLTWSQTGQSSDFWSNVADGVTRTASQAIKDDYDGF